MLIRISTLISFSLIIAPIFLWYVVLVGSQMEFSLWRHGKTAIVLPVENYGEVNTSYHKKDGTRIIRKSYVANLNVRLDSGEIANIPRKPVTLERIQESYEKEIRIVFLPYKPEINHFVGEELPLFPWLLMSCITTFISFLWFRNRSKHRMGRV